MLGLGIRKLGSQAASLKNPLLGQNGNFLLKGKSSLLILISSAIGYLLGKVTTSSWSCLPDHCFPCQGPRLIKTTCISFRKGTVEGPPPLRSLEKPLLALQTSADGEISFVAEQDCMNKDEAVGDLILQPPLPSFLTNRTLILTGGFLLCF